MKKHLLLLPVVTLTSLIATAGCSDHAKDPDPTVTVANTTPAPVVTPPVVTAPAVTAPAASSMDAVAVAVPAPADPFAEISAVLDKTTMAQTAALAAPQQNMDRAINARIDAWKATGATSTTKAEETLALARTDFAQKLGALSTADDATWKNAKIQATQSLQSLQQAYREYLAGPVKN